MDALLVIDMQSYFDAANDPRTIAAVITEVKKAKKKGSFIYIMEYWGHGNTHDSIMNILKKYQKKLLIWKKDDDGSEEFQRMVNWYDHSLDHINICGVNLSYCVGNTAESLFKNGISVSILAHATNDINREDIYYNPINRKNKLPDGLLDFKKEFKVPMIFNNSIFKKAIQYANS